MPVFTRIFLCCVPSEVLVYDKRHKTEKKFSDGGIPDAHMVYRARKQRQMARRGEGSIIPLDDTQRFRDGNKAGRLVREDDENDDEDDSEGWGMMIIITNNVVT